MESAEKAFVTVPYASSPRRPFCAFSLVRNEDEPAAYRPVHIKQLAGALRRLAAHSLRGFVSEDRIDGMIMGHPQDAPRVSILTLPSIGHQHSDGLIRRVAFVEPADRDGALSAIIRRVLHGKTIAFEGACDCAPAELERIEVDGVISRYSDESRSWASVTPVLLPGHNQRRQDRSNHAKNLQRAHRLVCKSLQQAGINVGAHVEIDTVPYWQGALHAREYNPRDKLAHFPRFHVKLEFERPVCGPLSIGAGRHVGFGVLAACDHEES
jgi:CRISPR-associated protein Csb2